MKFKAGDVLIIKPGHFPRSAGLSGVKKIKIIRAYHDTTDYQRYDYQSEPYNYSGFMHGSAPASYIETLFEYENVFEAL